MDIANDLVRAFNDGFSTAQAQMSDEFAKLKRDLKDCRNELCLKCGNYRQAHHGACDGCRWRNIG